MICVWKVGAVGRRLWVDKKRVVIYYFRDKESSLELSFRRDGGAGASVGDQQPLLRG